MNTTAAVVVREASAVAEARRMAHTAGARLEFAERETGRLAIIATELATNLLKHAREGEILVRSLDGPGQPRAVEIIAAYKGPGMRDPDRSRRDGHSTAGTLGHGLGAVERQADTFDIYSQPSGTVVLAHVAREAAGHDSGLAHGQTPLLVGGILVSMAGEQVCGDDWAWRGRQDRLTILVSDGLGHGLQAHDASRKAVEAFHRVHAEPPVRALEEIHEALRPTRGAAVSMLTIDLDRGVARHAAIGNISGVVIQASGARQGMVSLAGTAGHVVPRLQEFSYPVPRGAVIVLHSDGVAQGWDLGAYPGLRDRHPSVIAAVLYRDHCRRRDDASVVVVRERT